MGVRHDRSKPGRARCGDIIAGDGLILTEVDGEDLHDHVLLCVRTELSHLDSSSGSQRAHCLHGFYLDAKNEVDWDSPAFSVHVSRQTWSVSLAHWILVL